VPFSALDREPGLSRYKCVESRRSLCRGLKERGNAVSSDLVERAAKGDGALWAGKTPWPTALHGRNDSSLVFDESLKQIWTGHTQISHVFSTRADS